jgi:hypothetical protein
LDFYAWISSSLCTGFSAQDLFLFFAPVVDSHPDFVLSESVPPPQARKRLVFVLAPGTGFSLRSALVSS